MVNTVIIIGAGPAGIYAAYRLINNGYKNKIIIFDKGNSLNNRVCPISIGKVKSCVKCSPCNIMEGYGGAGSFSDAKFNITNDFGGMLYKKIGKAPAISLMYEVDTINEIAFGDAQEFPKKYSSSNNKFKKICLQNGLKLLDAEIRHLGTDKNRVVIQRLYDFLIKNNVEFHFNTEVKEITKDNKILTNKNEWFSADKLIIAVGRSGSHWLQNICKSLNIETKSNNIDLGVRVELPYEVFSDLTDELYESKIIYTTKDYQDQVRTFCMNPKGIVVNENTNGIVTVNGHSFENPEFHTENTNFALLVSQHFTEPFNDSNAYGESIARLSNMLGGGVIIQRFGDLIRCKRSTNGRIEKNTVIPTLKATPGDLSLVLPRRILNDIIEMIYALDKIAPGTANDDTLLYGVEVKFYNMEVQVDNNLKINDNVYIIGDGSGITHSLSQAAASGLYVGNYIYDHFVDNTKI